LEDAYRGTEVDLELEVPEYDGPRYPRRVAARIQSAHFRKASTDGQRLRLPAREARG